MKQIRAISTALMMACVMLVAPRVLAAQADPKIDVSGKWLFSVTTDAGTGTPTVVFKQTGDSLSGHYSSQTLGEAEIKGTIKDRKLNFSFTTSVQGTTITVTYTGTVESNDALKGTLDLAGQATGTFTAKRDK